jgi:predicted TIM-barrel fold metal-dependent hydrolase
VIDPDLPIVDTHHHFYDTQGYTYRLDDFLDDVNSGHNVVATVYVQAYWSYRTEGPENMKPLGETERALAMAAEAGRRGTRSRVCAAIVGYAELTLGAEVEPVLAAQIVVGAGRFKGIRYITGRNPHFIASISNPPAFGLMATDAFRAGFALLDRFKLSFDAWLYHPQIEELVDLARAFPHTPIVLNHFGGPLGIGPYRGKRQEVFADWHKAIKTLATCPNVHMKLGGQGLVLSGFDFNKREMPPSSAELAGAWGPYILAVIEAFGVKRCMFESNFPPDKNTCSYAVIWNAFKRIATGATAEEKRALFHDTASRFYRL